LYEYMFRHPELLETSLAQEYQEHIKIIDAIAARDGDKAAQSVYQHVHNLGQELAVFLNVPADLLQEKETQLSSLIA